MSRMSSKIENKIYTTIRYLNKPFWKASEYFLSKGIAYRIGGAIAGLVTAPFALLAETLSFFSQAYYRRSYLFYQVPGRAALGDPKKFLSFNVCMMQGGLPIVFGGMRPAAQRMEKLAQFINDQDADIVCLQEMAFDSSVELIKRIKDQYFNFYYRIGPNPFRMESALFWASKQAPIQEPQFIPYNVPGMQWGFKRGFFVTEFTNQIVITTHLNPGQDRGVVRTEQIKKIVEYIQQKKMTKQLFLMGDFNIESKDTEAQELLKQHFANFNEQAVKNPTKDNATCYENCPEKPAQWAVYDHILVKDGAEGVTERALAFDPNKISEALSDHHAVTLTLGKRQANDQ